MSNLNQQPDTLAEGEWPSGGLEFVESCPLCENKNHRALHKDLTDHVYFSAPGKWDLYRCDGCGCAYLNPRPTVDTIGLAYRSYFTHEPEPERAIRKSGLGLLKRMLRNGYLNARYGVRLSPALSHGRWITPLIPWKQAWHDLDVRPLALRQAGARMLDIGCGSGAFIRHAVNLGWNAEGLDPDPVAAAVGQKSGLCITTGSLPNTDFPDASFAAVTMSHSIEHLHDPIGCLREVYRILQPGGAIWVATPNLNSQSHKFFGKHWIGLQAPGHLVLFTAETLEAALTRVGFKDVAQVRGPCRSKWYFTSSYKAARGEANPICIYGTRLPMSLRIRAAIADCVGFFEQRQENELLFVASRPLTE